MKALHVTHFGDADNLAFVEDAPKPEFPPGSDDILVKVLACALNAGDDHVMRGHVSLVVKPKQFPYTPGMDVCGVVEAVGERCTTFAKGDRVAVVLGPIERHGGLAEYLVCSAKQAALAPVQLTPLQVASLPIAGTTAVQAVNDARIGTGSRVVVLGASGGVGSLVVQLAKARGASFVAATSTNAALVTSLGADRVIDYRAAKWWEALRDEAPLDAVVDCVGCDESWANCGRMLVRRGRYVAVSNMPEPHLRSVGELLGYLASVLSRVLNPFTTSYKMVVCFPTGDELKAVMDLASEGKLRAVLDPMAPCTFSLAGAQEAFALLRSHRAKGKLAFKVSDAE